MKTRKFPTNLSIVFSFSILMLPLLAGCGTTGAGAVQPQPGDQGETETESGRIDLGDMGTIEVGIEPTPLPERSSYTNDVYGFAFDYPETWTLTEEDHRVILQKGTNRLGINFRLADEQIDRFGRTGIGAGDLIYAGKVKMMDQVIPAEALFFEQATKAVFYGGTGHIEINDLVFVIALEDLETDYMDVNPSDEIITEAGKILESFRTLETMDGTEISAEPSGLEAYLKVQSPILQGSREPVIVYFLLENHTQQGLYLLKWFTPLEGIGGDIFAVRRDGQSVPYLGPMVSREVPTPESYIFVGSDNGVTAEVNIAEAYDFSQPGTYTIKFRSPRISHLAQSEAEMATTLDELGPVNIPSSEVTLEIVASSAAMEQPVRRTIKEAGEMISAYLLEKNPGLMKAPPLTYEEVPSERVWKELEGQVFRVTGGIFKNESFLLLNGNVIQLGESVGGQGLTSLVVTDLDQDGQPELFFTYTAALGPGIGSGIQTRVGMVDPEADLPGVIEADMAYLGIAALRLEESNAISLNILESDEANKVLRYLDNLGYLSIENKELGKLLILTIDPNLPSELKEKILTNG